MNLTIDTQLSEIEFLAKIVKHSFAFSQYLNTKLIFIYIHATFFIRSTTIFLEEKKLTIRKSIESLSTNM